MDAVDGLVVLVVVDTVETVGDIEDDKEVKDVVTGEIVDGPDDDGGKDEVTDELDEAVQLSSFTYSTTPEMSLYKFSISRLS